MSIIVTLLGALYIFALVAEFVALAYIGVPEFRDIRPRFRYAAWYAPPYVAALVWAVYRVVWFARGRWFRDGARASAARTK